jgi:hypothetical protein
MDALCDRLVVDASICIDLMVFRPMGMFERPTNFSVEFDSGPGRVTASGQ